MIKQISSKENKLIKLVSSLKEKKYRDREGLYLLEGPNFVKDAIMYGGRVRFIFIRAGADSVEIAQTEALAEKKGIDTYRLTDEVFQRVSSTETSQGIVAAAEKNETTQDEFFEKGGNILVLDRVQDPGNAGTMLRTAEAMGFKGVLLLKGSADIYGPKAVRAAAGSILRLPVFFAESPGEAVSLFQKYGKRPYAAAMSGKLEVFEADLSSDAAVIIGSEGNGVCEELLQSAEGISIPMAGKIESLNAALAAGMIMYESMRQRINKDGGIH